MAKHVTTYFLDWSEGRLSPSQQSSVEAHLLTCPECKAYYDKMSITLDVVHKNELPELAPDPYLPTRIAALAKERRQKELNSSASWTQRARIAVTTAMFIGGIGIGVFLGKGLATLDDATVSETDLISEYSEALWQETFAESWESLMINNGEEQQ